MTASPMASTALSAITPAALTLSKARRSNRCIASTRHEKYYFLDIQNKKKKNFYILLPCLKNKVTGEYNPIMQNKISPFHLEQWAKSVQNNPWKQFLFIGILVSTVRLFESAA